MSSTGGHGGEGITDSVNGRTYQSGGGGMAVNGVGRGGAANYAQGDAGIAAGGAGCMIARVDDITGEVTMRIGSGGGGMCYITYYQRVNVPDGTKIDGAITVDSEGNIVSPTDDTTNS